MSHLEMEPTSSRFLFSVIPAHAQRSVGGGFDNECVALLPQVACGYFWCRMFTERTLFGKLLTAALSGASFAYMAWAWGGYVFLINLVGRWCATW